MTDARDPDTPVGGDMATVVASAAVAGAEPILLTRARSQWWDVWDQFRSHKGAMAGAAIFLAIVGLVVFGPLFVDLESGIKSNMRSRNLGASLAHPLGTDRLGRDMFARMIAGDFKRLDGPLMRFTDLFLALPLLPLLLVMVLLFREPLTAAFGVETGIFILIVAAIGVTSWMQTARIVRGDVLALKEREFVLAARSIGTPSRRIVTRHVLPNVLSPIMVSATLGIATAIITESALSFLGLGFPPDFPTWGRLLNDGVPYLELYPGRAFWPGAAISLVVLSINYVGDGLRDALDPRIRGR